MYLKYTNLVQFKGQLRIYCLMDKIIIAQEIELQQKGILSDLLLRSI